ncbi:hypothetical protein [Streptomyces sp. A30]|uniref:hypothetical protein n=1 Tax=Streptomyces sp. A30 TaxID=2789273 RepID=UPI0039801FB2
MLDDGPHRGVGVLDDPVGIVVDIADRQALLQLAAAGLGQLPAPQPGPEQVEFGLRHGALQAQHEPVVEGPRIIQTVLVQDQRPGQRTDLQQPVRPSGELG